MSDEASPTPEGTRMIMECLLEQRASTLRTMQAIALERDTAIAERDATIRELRKVQAERDRARRQLCYELWLSRGQQCSLESIAKARGWGCFKEEP